MKMILPGSVLFRAALPAGIALLGLVTSGTPAMADGSRLVRASVSSDGEQATPTAQQVQAQQTNAFGALVSGNAVVSNQGRFTAFHSNAVNLVPGDTNGYYDVFVRDAMTGATSRVSLTNDGTQSDDGGVRGTGNSYRPSISADGRYVAFESGASNLVPGDTNGTQDLFVRDRIAGTTTRVNVSSAGEQANRISREPALSSDGRYLAFKSNASNLVADDLAGPGVFVRDLVAGTTIRASITIDEKPIDFNAGDFTGISIAANGRYVGFTSLASNLVPGDTNDYYDAFVRDLVAGTTIRVSVLNNGAETTGSVKKSSISADGRYVVFDSNAELLEDGPFRDSDIYVRDLVAGTTTLVSVSNTGGQSDGSSTRATISDDGRYVSFESSASNLVPGDTNNKTDVFVRDLVAGVTTRVSSASTGEQANGESALSSMSPDGRAIAFTSWASNLVAGDTNRAPDAFVSDLNR